MTETIGTVTNGDIYKLKDMKKYEQYYNQYLNTNPNPIVGYNRWVADHSTKPDTRFSVEVKLGENIICKRKWHYINKDNDFTGFYPEMVNIITEAINVVDPKVKAIFNDEITIIFTNNEHITTYSFVSNRSHYKIDIKDKVNRFKNLMAIKEKATFVPPVYETPVVKKTYSIFKKRLFRSDKLIADNLSQSEAVDSISKLMNHYTFGILGFPYYVK